MVSLIPKFAKNVWSKWNIRGVVLVSLTLQIILIFMAPFRKRSRTDTLVFLLWSTYLIADYTANYCVGLISNKYGDKDTPISTVNDYLLAFWTPFLLLHLGGPDTITAFALEDNELWLRHLLGLIVQVCLTGYVFLLTLPNNTLWLPTALVFMAGIIKFAERTRSLQLASAANFRQSMVRKPDPGPNYAKLMEEYKSRLEAGLPTKIVKMPEISEYESFNEPEAFPDGEKNPNESINGNATKDEVENDHVDGPPPNTAGSNDIGNKQDATVQEEKDHDQEVLSDVKVVKEAYRYFGIFKGLVVDMIFSFHERSESRTFFLGLTALDTLRVIEIELNFIYQAFYTKATVICNKVGFCFRFISIASVVAALVLFVLDQKRGCQEFDIKVTYTLLYGAVALDGVSFLMLILSDHSFASFPSLGSQKNDADSEEGPEKSKASFGFLKHLIEKTLKLATFRCILKLKKPVWKEKKIESPTWLKGRSYKILCRPILFRRWSETISAFNLISYCLHKKQRCCVDIIDYIGLKEVIEQWNYEKKQPLLQKLWIFIYTEVERKAGDADDVETIQRICSSRGEWVIQEGELNRDKLNKLMPYVEINTVTFDQCLILWHIATDLLFYGEIKQKEKENGQASDIETGSALKTDEVAGKESEKIAQENDPHVKKGSDDSFVTNNDPDVEELKDFSKLISDYLFYLIIMQPKMMSAVRGIAQIRFQDTCAEASNFFSKREVVLELQEVKKKRDTSPGKNMCNKLLQSITKCFEFTKKLRKKGEEHTEKGEEQTNMSEEPRKKGVEREVTEEQKACKKLSEVWVNEEPSAVKGDRSKSLLFDACKLAHVIKNELDLKENKYWKMIAQVWVELLSYAACNCIPITHVQQLSKGGEFISLVWLLMTHLGLAKQFQIKEGHARAKLIVGEDDQIDPK